MTEPGGRGTGGWADPETSAGDTNELLPEAFFTGSPMANPVPPPVAPLRALPLGGGPPRVASRFALPHPGLFLCGVSRRFSLALQAFFPVLIKALHFSLFWRFAPGKPLEEVLARLE